MDEQTSERGFFVSAALFVERYVLAVVFLWLAWGEWAPFYGLWTTNIANKAALYGGLIKHGALLTAGVFTSLFLLIGRKPASPPEKIRYVLVPLAATFFQVFYYWGARLPKSWHVNLLPADLQVPTAILGMVMIVSGPVIALWGLFSLGRLFGIYVAVRGIVLKGPYRWVRHPMYLGWIMFFVGIALALFSAAYLLIVAAHVSLIVYRARLEERNLAEKSVEYREHMKRTGFLLPRLRRG